MHPRKRKQEKKEEKLCLSWEQISIFIQIECTSHENIQKTFHIWNKCFQLCYTCSLIFSHQIQGFSFFLAFSHTTFIYYAWDMFVVDSIKQQMIYNHNFFYVQIIEIKELSVELLTTFYYLLLFVTLCCWNIRHILCLNDHKFSIIFFKLKAKAMNQVGKHFVPFSLGKF